MSRDINFDCAEKLISLEAWLIDQRNWNSWLSLYKEDCLFWAPAWLDESEIASNPDKEISFLYLKGKIMLRERVNRLSSGRSITTVPQIRTTHILSKPVLLSCSNRKFLSSDSKEEVITEIRIGTSWVNHVYDPRINKNKELFGSYEHVIHNVGDDLKIYAKKIILSNDRLATVLDFNYL